MWNLIDVLSTGPPYAGNTLQSLISYFIFFLLFSQLSELSYHPLLTFLKVESVVIASEPLTMEQEYWKLVPPNHLLVVTTNQRTIIEPIKLPVIDEAFNEMQEGISTLNIYYNSCLLNISVTLITFQWTPVR